MAAAVNWNSTYPLAVLGYTFPGYTALYTVILNLIIVVVLTPLLSAIGSRSRSDETSLADYFA